MFANFVDLALIRSWGSWLRYLASFAFKTGVGEPFVSPDVNAIVRHMGSEYSRMKQSVTANGLWMDSKTKRNTGLNAFQSSLCFSPRRGRGDLRRSARRRF